MGIYSHSKLSTFEQCPFKFKLRYIDKIIPEIEKSIEAHLGTSIHETLEWLYLEVLKLKKIPSLDEVITFYSNRWQDNFNDKILIVREKMTSKDYFDKGIKFLIDYYLKHEPFQDGTIELEKEINLKLGEHKIKGFVDRIVKNPETEEIEIHDYKTGNYLPTQEKFDTDRQLALYSIAIKEIFGQEQKICLVWHYLAHNKKISSKRTNEQLEKLKKETLELIKKIESTMEYPTNKTPLCDWCEYKNLCPDFKK
jgi:putative RecB family exonuclease